MREVNDLSNDKCKQGGCYSDHVIRVCDIVRCVKMLKRGKADCSGIFSSDNIINACPELYVHLAFLFNMMISHSRVPTGMLMSTLVPIPKDKKKSLSDSANYRMCDNSGCDNSELRQLGVGRVVAPRAELSHPELSRIYLAFYTNPIIAFIIAII